MVESAAIRKDDVTYSVPPPARHHDVIRYMVEGCGLAPPCSGEQGFIVTGGRFVGRVEAGKIAVEGGQIAKLERPPRLYSEDLW
jgi:hypothetical protein